MQICCYKHERGVVTLLSTLFSVQTPCGEVPVTSCALLALARLATTSQHCPQKVYKKLNKPGEGCPENHVHNIRGGNSVTAY